MVVATIFITKTILFWNIVVALLDLNAFQVMKEKNKRQQIIALMHKAS